MNEVTHIPNKCLGHNVMTKRNTPDKRKATPAVDRTMNQLTDKRKATPAVDPSPAMAKCVRDSFAGVDGPP
eukprot:scaffold13841_cov65-Cyclotella_meneghiniana.AAC.2